MRTYRYESQMSEIKKDRANGVIFLAGPTVRGHQQHLQPSWRFEATRLIDDTGYDGSVIIPEFNNISESDQHRNELPRWEMEGMTLADVIMFWVPRTKELIALTTNFELGYWLARDRAKVLYGRPDGAYRTDYLDNIWEYDLEICQSVFPVTKIFNELGDLVNATVQEVKDRLEFERKYLSEKR